MNLSPGRASLGEVALINPKLTDALNPDAPISFVAMKDVSESGRTTEGTTRPYKDVSKGYRPFRKGDLLVAKITPCFENNKIAQATTANAVGFGSTEFHVVRPIAGQAEPRYLLHYLRQDSVRRIGASQMTGSAGQRRIPEHFLADLQVPLPPLGEQRRIAYILDIADGLRTKWRAHRAVLGELEHATFAEISSSQEWPTAALEELLVVPLRNGVSPSSEGRLNFLLLTLSAVTGDKFADEAVKEGRFVAEPPLTQRVDDRDFLICRGNGNLSMVGRGHFPTRSRLDVVFPDTIIAARPDSRLVDPVYLEHAWASAYTRRQIESAAHTTNGTHKINQHTTGKVRLRVPPRHVQATFANKVAPIRDLQAAADLSTSTADELYYSLQQRAFNDEL